MVLAVLAVMALSCGQATSAQHHVVGTTATARATPAPRSYVTVVPAMSAAQITNAVAESERRIRSDDTPPGRIPELAARQQDAYLNLALHPEWRAAVLARLPSEVRGVADANVTAVTDLLTLNGTPSERPHWRVVAPEPPDRVLDFYHEAEATFAVPWAYLAAINFVESAMGRIQGLSSAGAQGPMQFMPATWQEYGRGDIDDPHDAILAAARFLSASGAPDDMARALFHYNPASLYVEAVTLFAGQMLADSHAFSAYYNWRPYVRTAAGMMLLEQGYEP